MPVVNLTDDELFAITAATHTAHKKYVTNIRRLHEKFGPDANLMKMDVRLGLLTSALAKLKAAE